MCKEICVGNFNIIKLLVGLLRFHCATKQWIYLGLFQNLFGSLGYLVQ